MAPSAAPVVESPLQSTVENIETNFQVCLFPLEISFPVTEFLWNRWRNCNWFCFICWQPFYVLHKASSRKNSRKSNLCGKSRKRTKLSPTGPNGIENPDAEERDGSQLEHLRMETLELVWSKMETTIKVNRSVFYFRPTYLMLMQMLLFVFYLLIATVSKNKYRVFSCRMFWGILMLKFLMIYVAGFMSPLLLFDHTGHLVHLQPLGLFLLLLVLSIKYCSQGWFSLVSSRFQNFKMMYDTASRTLTILQSKNIWVSFMTLLEQDMFYRLYLSVFEL